MSRSTTPAPTTVYILSIFLNNSPRPTDILPFSSEERMRMHVCELIAKHGLANLDEGIKRKLIMFLEMKDQEKIIVCYRRAQTDNSIRPGLDFTWTGPVVVL